MDRRATAFILLVCVAQYLFFSNRVPVPDVAWLIEGARRWLNGAVLYRDVREVNPPLVFYEMILLTGAQFTARSYVIGVSAVTTLSALLVLRIQGPKLALAALAAMVIGGFTAFGQRDHLALIFAIPFVLAAGSPKVRSLIGLWAFFGVGLKPYLLPIVLFPILARWWTTRKLVTAENITLGICCLLYLAAILVFHPIYLSEMVPLGRFVYWAYGLERPNFIILAMTVVLLFACIAAQNRVLGAAVVGGLASYYLQAKFWPYHFIPASGFGLLLCLVERGLSFKLVALLLTFVQTARLVEPRIPRAPIPFGQSATFLSSHVQAAYPTSLLCGVRNASRYPAIWPIPGAWNIYVDKTRSTTDRAKAKAILVHERDLIRQDILTLKPDLIFADAREKKIYFQRPFDYMKFVGPLPEYHKVAANSRYEIWARNGLNSSLCVEKL